MKYTFTYESNKHENKTITISFNAVNGEKTILDNFFNFMKAVGYVYGKNEVLKIVNELDEYKKNFNGLDFVYPPNYSPNLSDLNLSGLPGISEDSFIKPDFKVNVSNVSSHGHGTRGFVGPADC